MHRSAQKISRSDIQRLLVPHAAAIANAFDSRVLARKDLLSAGSKDEVVSVLLANARSATVDIVSASSGKPRDEVLAMSDLDQMIALLEVFSSIFEDVPLGEALPQIVGLIADAASQSSAIVTGNYRQH